MTPNPTKEESKSRYTDEEIMRDVLDPEWSIQPITQPGTPPYTGENKSWLVPFVETVPVNLGGILQNYLEGLQKGHVIGDHNFYVRYTVERVVRDMEVDFGWACQLICDDRNNPPSDLDNRLYPLVTLWFQKLPTRTFYGIQIRLKKKEEV